MSGAEPLLRAACQVDVIDAAGVILSNPQRHAPAATAATVLALASGVEAFWAICLEAEMLARADARRNAIRNQGLLNCTEAQVAELNDQDARAAAISRAIIEAMAALRGNSQTNQENADGNR